MIKTWFISDTHFWAEYLIKDNWHGPRPFADVEAMNQGLLDNWNQRVAPEDRVFVVGDLSNKEGPELSLLFSKLNGEKHLVTGNHDDIRPKVLELPWASPPSYQRLIRVENSMVYLSHFPLRSWPRMKDGVLHLYGHVHGTLAADNLSCDVGVDLWDYRPITLEEAKKRMKDSGVEHWKIRDIVSVGRENK